MTQPVDPVRLTADLIFVKVDDFLAARLLVLELPEGGEDDQREHHPR